MTYCQNSVLVILNRLFFLDICFLYIFALKKKFLWKKMFLLFKAWYFYLEITTTPNSNIHMKKQKCTQKMSFIDIFSSSTRIF